MKYIKTLGMVVAILVSLTALGGSSWGAFELYQQVAENTSWRVLRTYAMFEEIRKKRRLTYSEWLQWCKAGRQLKAFEVCPRR